MADAIEDTRDAFYEYKRTMMNGPVNGVLPNPPTFSVLVLPETGAVGMVTNLKAVVRRSKVAPGYTTQIGEDMGWVDSGPPQNPFPAGGPTAAMVVTAVPSGRVSIAFSKQNQDAMRAEFKRKNDTEWSLAGIYTSTPGIHDVSSVPPGDPESRQYRGILLKQNVPVGNYSPIYTKVTTP